jgi:hypothetical protein
VLVSLGLPDRTIVINYPIVQNCVDFPGAVCDLVNTSGMPVVTRNELASTDRDCLWVWDDLYSQFPANLNDIIKTIKLTDDFSRSLDMTVGSREMVGIHARFGDYVRVDSKNPPAAMPPFVRGSNSYFLNAVKLCRASKFYLASDGTDEELEFLTCNPDIMRGKHNEPLFDLFALSRCKFIIGSGSTFSSCAAAYGGIPLIIPNTSDSEIESIIESCK